MINETRRPKMNKRKVGSIVCFSLAGLDFIGMVIHVLVWYRTIVNDKVSGLPANTAFLLVIPYGLVFVALLVTAFLLRKPKKQ
jgi:hypothetical protein